MSVSGDAAQGLRVDLDRTLPQILSILRAVEDGDLMQEVQSEFSEDHPAGALCASVNSLMGALRVSRATSAESMAEIMERLDIIERQRQAISTLTVPVIQVWDGVLCTPIVGLLDSTRAAELTAALLGAVVERKASYVIVDLTGIEVMDTQTTDHFLRMAHGVTLLGAKCALSGIHPNIARMVVQMGIGLGGLRCFRTMREALKACVDREQQQPKVADPITETR